jgi:hypothetical protein
MPGVTGVPAMPLGCVVRVTGATDSTTPQLGQGAGFCAMAEWKVPAASKAAAGMRQDLFMAVLSCPQRTDAGCLIR